MLLHPHATAIPSKPSPQEHSTSAGCFDFIHKLQVCNLVLPASAEDAGNDTRVQMLQLLDEFAVED